MNNRKWAVWVMQTARSWYDIIGIYKHTSIDFIDNDHKNIIEFGLKLNREIEKVEHNYSLLEIDNISSLMGEFYAMSSEHFKQEEVFMTKYNLPNTEDHKNEHIRLLDTFEHIMSDFKRGKIKAVSRFKYKIIDWIIDHVNEYDYGFFDLKNWTELFSKSNGWSDIKEIIHLTGIEEMDKQYTQIFDHGIAFIEALKITEDAKGKRKLIEDFKSIVMHHFDYQETFIDKYDISNCEDHIKQHEYLLEQLDHYQNIESNLELDQLKIKFLTWFVEHINEVDSETFNQKKWTPKLINEAKSFEDVSVVLKRLKIEKLDGLHIDFIEEILLLNNLIEQQLNADEERKNDNNADIVICFNNLYKIAERHFEEEKHFMLDNDFGNIQNYMTESESILERLGKLKENYEAGRIILSSNIKTMIFGWWLYHTNIVNYSDIVINGFMTENQE